MYVCLPHKTELLQKETILLTPVYPSPRTMSDSHSGEYSLGALDEMKVNEWEGGGEWEHEVLSLHLTQAAH